MLKYIALSLFLATTALGALLPQTQSEGPESSKNTQRIVGGYEVNIFKHPHQVSLRYRYENSRPYSHLCGGSIYKDNVIITAAHCVSDMEPNNFTIAAGTNNRAGGDGILALVSKIIVHDEYYGLDNDIAIMILSTPLPLNNATIASISLATEQPKHGAKATVTGWGDTLEGGYLSNKLLEVQVNVISNDRCDASYAGIFGGTGIITQNMICAGIEGVGGKDACQGDSGGPFLVKNQLAGIVSWGYGCAMRDYPGVYTNVVVYLDWIESNIKKYA